MPETVRAQAVDDRAATPGTTAAEAEPTRERAEPRRRARHRVEPARACGSCRPTRVLVQLQVTTRLDDRDALDAGLVLEPGRLGRDARARRRDRRRRAGSGAASSGPAARRRRGSSSRPTCRRAGERPPPGASRGCGARAPRWSRSSSASSACRAPRTPNYPGRWRYSGTQPGRLGVSARRGATTCARAGAPSTKSAQQCAEPEKAEVNGDRRGEPDPSGRDTRPRRHPLRRRLRRRHAARRRPLHGAVGRVRQRPGDAARTSRPRSAPRPARSPACRRSRCTSPTTTSRPRATRPTCWSR